MIAGDEPSLSRVVSRTPLVEYFASHRMFGVLPAADLDELGAEVVERRYQKRECLCYAGDPPSNVFVIRSGLVALTENDERGNLRATLTFSPGHVFGASAAVLGCPHSGTAIAVVDTEVYVLRHETFDRLYRHCPELSREVIRELHDLTCRAQETIIQLTMRPIGARVAAFLLRAGAGAAGSDEEPSDLDLMLSHHDIALLLGTSRETVSRVLTRLARAKLIAATGRHVRILSAQGLRRLARS